MSKLNKLVDDIYSVAQRQNGAIYNGYWKMQQLSTVNSEQRLHLSNVIIVALGGIAPALSGSSGSIYMQCGAAYSNFNFGSRAETKHIGLVQENSGTECFSIKNLETNAVLPLTWLPTTSFTLKVTNAMVGVTYIQMTE